MCGIVGIMRFDGVPVDPALLSVMADQLVHRGPDGHGTWVDGSVGFGHRRLSIIDLEGSPQPMASVDDRLHITLNGEILNYLDCGVARATRSEATATPRPCSPCSTIAGRARSSSPPVQFAYAIHDNRDGSMWLFRDRLGILPLYYSIEDRQLVFASGIKAMLPALPRRPDVDGEGLAAYLAHRSVPSPRTLFAGVRKLPPGHRLRVTADGKTQLERWWTIPAVDTTQRIRPGTTVDLVAEALDQSIDRNLVADVPVGAHLSGGVGGSLITALMNRRAGVGHVHTFSAGFGDPRLDEVTVTADDFERLWPTLTWHRDAPISEPADVAVYRLAELARQQVKVVLSGEGSDELFAGYPKYRFARASAWAGLVPSVVRRPAVDLAQRHLPARLNRARIAVRALDGPDGGTRRGGVWREVWAQRKDWISGYVEPQHAVVERV